MPTIDCPNCNLPVHTEFGPVDNWITCPGCQESFLIPVHPAQRQSGPFAGESEARQATSTGLRNSALPVTTNRLPVIGYILISVLALLIGLAFIGLGSYGLLSMVPSKDELIVVNGVPQSVSFSQSFARRGRQIEHMDFRIGGLQAKHNSIEPDYPEVRSAVQSGQILEVGLRPTPTGDGWHPIWQMKAGNRTIISYGSRAARETTGHTVMLILGLALAAVGASLTLVFIRRLLHIHAGRK